MACEHRAIVIVTRDVKGTSSNLASSRTEIACTKPAGHEGLHEDSASGNSWKDRGDTLTHILKSEDEV